MELHSMNENNFEMKAPTMSLFDYRQFFAGLLPFEINDFESRLKFASNFKTTQTSFTFTDGALGN